MPSPSGVFRNLTVEQLAEIEASALDRITNGQRTSMSGSGRSGSYAWDMSPEQILREVEFARNPTPNRSAEQIVKRGGQWNSY